MTQLLDIAPSDASALDIVAERLGSEEWKKIDRVDEFVGQLPPVDMPLRHIFTPGLYLREIYMFAGTLATTRIHLKEHPFVILKGRVSVWNDESGWVTLSAPYHGITLPGTRRIIYVHEDTVWLTFHVTDKTDPDEIAREVTYCGGKFENLGIASAHHNAPSLLP